VSGADSGNPETIYGSEKMMLTNDHARSWDGKQIAITGIALPLPAKVSGSDPTPSRDFLGLGWDESG
jgi:hypothetical protein